MHGHPFQSNVKYNSAEKNYLFTRVLRKRRQAHQAHFHEESPWWRWFPVSPSRHFAWWICQEGMCGNLYNDHKHLKCGIMSRFCREIVPSKRTSFAFISQTESRAFIKLGREISLTIIFKIWKWQRDCKKSPHPSGKPLKKKGQITLSTKPHPDPRKVIDFVLK